MSKLIGICGLKGAGKDTIAKMMPIEWKKMAFADTLKDITAMLFGWERFMLEGSTEQSREWRETVSNFWEKELGIKGFTPRMALQMLGTEVFRNHFNQDIWVKVLKHRIINSNDNIVVTDVRFPNEVNMIKELGGKIVQVIRGDLPEWWPVAEEWNKEEHLPEGEPLGFIDKDGNLISIHPSEYSLAGIIEPDYIIHNDSDLGFLHTKVDDMLNRLYS